MYESPGIWALILAGFTIPLWVVLLVIAGLGGGLYGARKWAQKRRRNDQP